MTMFTKCTKVLIAALVLAATSLAFVANASARPSQPGGWYQGGNESYMRERHDPTNTNGY
jgi:Spy/CpxP family protein refolding chaperone